MIKVTLNDNLVPYGILPSTTCTDLTENLFLAKHLIRGAIQFFHLDAERIRFSGYVDEAPGEFRIEVWYQGQPYRIARFPRFRRSGVLKCEVMFGKIQLALKLDLLGTFQGALDETAPEAVEVELATV